MRAAQIENGRVIEVYMVESLDFLPGLVPDPDLLAGVGDLYDDVTGAFVKPVLDQGPAPALDEFKRRLAQSVDSAIAAIYNRWTRFGPEYDAREAAAREFKATSYAGTPSIWVRSFAVPAGLSPRDAADMIIAQADALHIALEQLGAQRMAKYGIMGALDAAAAQRIHDDIIAAVSLIERGLP